MARSSVGWRSTTPPTPASSFSLSIGAKTSASLLSARQSPRSKWKGCKPIDDTSAPLTLSSPRLLRLRPDGRDRSRRRGGQKPGSVLHPSLHPERVQDQPDRKRHRDLRSAADD